MFFLVSGMAVEMVKARRSIQALGRLKEQVLTVTIRRPSGRPGDQEVEQEDVQVDDQVGR